MMLSKNRLNALLALLFSCFIGISAQGNSLTIEDFTIVPGEEKTVEINLTNEDAISSLQFDIVLPEGLEMIEESVEKVSARITKTSHNLSVSNRGDFFRVTIFSNAVDIKKSGIKGNEGAILTFTVQAYKNFKSGNIELKNIVGSDGTKPIPEAKHMDDYVAKVSAFAGSYSVCCSDSLIAIDEESVVAFRLDDAVDIVGLQLDIILPDSISFATNEDGDYSISLSDRVSENARISMNEMSNGAYRVIVTSLTNEVFDSSTDTLFTVGVIADTAFTSIVNLEFKNVKVSDPNGNAYTIEGEGVLSFGYADPQIESDEAYARLTAEVNELRDSLAAVVAVIAETCPDVKDNFTGIDIADSIEVVQAKLDSLNAIAGLTEESNIEKEKVVIYAAMDSLIAEANAMQEAFVLDPGTYYIRNVESGAFLIGGNSWGTQATVGKTGIDWDVTFVNGKYALDSKITNGGENHFLGINGFVDSNDKLVILLTEEGTYKISTPDGLVLTAPAIDAESTVVVFATDEGSKLATWEFVTREELDKNLLGATIEDVKDATYLIPGANFGRNDTRNNYWIFEASNKNISGGNNLNNNAESYHSVFSLSQTIDVPNGVYSMTAQGFYRQDGDDFENLPYFFANEELIAMPEKTGTENSMTDASVSFTEGLYTTDPIYFEVTDGKLTLGVKNEINTMLWCIWDNFQLRYYGSETTVDAVKNVVSIDNVNSNDQPMGIYTVNGVKVKSLVKGLNILVEKDGSVRKILVK